MEINSFAIKVKKEPTAISLFAGVGGLCTNLPKIYQERERSFQQIARHTYLEKTQCS